MPTGFLRCVRLAAFAALAFVVVVLGFARPAAAQLGTAGITGTTTTTASLADGDIFIGIQATEGANLAAFDLARFFNKANCECNVPVFVFFTLTQTGFAKRSIVPQGTVSFWVGSSCNDPLLQRTNCQPLGIASNGLSSEPIAQFMALGRATIPTNAQTISTNSIVSTTDVDGGVVTNGTTPNTSCTSTTNGFNQTVWAVFDYGSDGTLDYSAQQAVFVDLDPPPAPTGITVAPANEALNVSWTGVDYSLNMDLQGYQVFCSRGNEQVFANGTFGSAVRSCALTAGSGVAGLDPLFACSPLLNRTASSFRVKILQNDIYYAATVAAIDNSGNAVFPGLNGCRPDLQVDPDCSWQKPVKTDSFYDVYRNGNETNNGTTGPTPGAATGGFCAVGGESNPAGIAMGAGAGALALAAAFARARRRRR
jgi:MYXO-CTERM domain-containing protein